MVKNTNPQLKIELTGVEDIITPIEDKHPKP